MTPLPLSATNDRAAESPCNHLTAVRYSFVPSQQTSRRKKVSFLDSQSSFLAGAFTVAISFYFLQPGSFLPCFTVFAFVEMLSLCGSFFRSSTHRRTKSRGLNNWFIIWDEPPSPCRFTFMKVKSLWYFLRAQLWKASSSSVNAVRRAAYSENAWNWIAFVCLLT